MCLALGLAPGCGEDGNPVSWTQEPTSSSNHRRCRKKGGGLFKVTQGPSDRAGQKSESSLCPGQGSVWELSRRTGDPRWHMLPSSSEAQTLETEFQAALTLAKAPKPRALCTHSLDCHPNNPPSWCDTLILFCWFCSHRRGTVGHWDLNLCCQTQTLPRGWSASFEEGFGK